MDYGEFLVFLVSPEIARSRQLAIHGLSKLKLGSTAIDHREFTSTDLLLSQCLRYICKHNIENFRTFVVDIQSVWMRITHRVSPNDCHSVDGGRVHTSIRVPSG